MLIEKAWAKANGGYENIAGGNYLPGSGGFMQAFTGKQTEAYRSTEAPAVDESKPGKTQTITPEKVSSDELFDKMHEAFQDGRSLTFGTLKTTNPDLVKEIGDVTSRENHNLSEWHGYAVMNVQEENGKRTVTAFNPWGRTETYDFSQLAKYLDRVYIN